MGPRTLSLRTRLLIIGVTGVALALLVAGVAVGAFVLAIAAIVAADPFPAIVFPAASRR